MLGNLDENVGDTLTDGLNWGVECNREKGDMTTTEYFGYLEEEYGWCAQDESRKKHPRTQE